MYAQLVTHLQASKDQLNATRAELTLTKEEVKQAKDAIAWIESQFGSSTSWVPPFPFPFPSIKDLACVVHMIWYLK